MSGRDYDAIIVGASFAGLAVARRLTGRVLLLDRNEVGAVQTSACGTPLWVPQALGVADSVLQVHDKLTVRAPKRTVTYDLSAVPFCTFDYKPFCEGLLGQTRARFLRAAVTGVEDGAVLTRDGRFTAPVIAARWPRPTTARTFPTNSSGPPWDGSSQWATRRDNACLLPPRAFAPPCTSAWSAAVSSSRSSTAVSVSPRDSSATAVSWIATATPTASCGRRSGWPSMRRRAGSSPSRDWPGDSRCCPAGGRATAGSGASILIPRSSRETRGLDGEPALSARTRWVLVATVTV